jgi:uncharacterized protein YjeT (DUF2065 family)
MLTKKPLKAKETLCWSIQTVISSVISRTAKARNKLPSRWLDLIVTEPPKVVEFANRIQIGSGFFVPIQSVFLFGNNEVWEELGKAFCLMLVFEGVIPFLYPARWRNMVVNLAVVNDRQLRTMGFVSMVFGAGLLYFIN